MISLWLHLVILECNVTLNVKMIVNIFSTHMEMSFL